eukprot:TRINITY_DN14618_c0_g1_i1.p1 TRINITY_DN14618_c0_g1~~TRINITY_DN14618_c0_g1_i1.p1  ORF type:complete len:265 (-),score=55.52 TRINITY_DN14618_c0_g1_i1:30-824(-)
MSAERLIGAFQKKRAAFVAYVPCGYPSPSASAPLLLALQNGGADIIELGVPFTDPLADGNTIQRANHHALTHFNVSLADCLATTKAARAAGLTIPVVLMGYYNPILAYGELALLKDCKEYGVDGLIVVDLPPEEAVSLISLCHQHDIGYIPLVAPTTSDSRLKKIVTLANSWIYCVSSLGVTGQRSTLPPELEALVAKVKQYTDKPVAVGFGISTREHVEAVAKMADGVVMGSAIVNAIDIGGETDAEKAQYLENFVKSVSGTQ